MKHLSVVFRLRLLLGISVSALALVVGALFLLTSNLSNGLGSLLYSSAQSNKASFAAIQGVSQTQETLFRLLRERDSDTIEVLVARFDVTEKAADSLIATLKSKSLDQAQDRLAVESKEVLDHILKADLGMAQQMLVERYTPAFSALLEGINAYNQQESIRLESDRKAQQTEAAHYRTIASLLSAIAVGLVLILGITIMLAVRNSLSGMTGALQDLVAGDADMTKRLQVSSQDEFGIMSKLFNQFLDQQSDLIRSVSDGTASVSSSTKPLSMSATQIAETAKGVSLKSQTVASAVEQSTTAISNITENASEMEQMISTVAAAMEELAASLRQTETRCVEEVKSTDEGAKLAEQTRETMSRLDTSAQEIGKMVDVIRDIAEQTNLLALNATIEAATAGEAGKGFAVVASEVKELAKQTAIATETIANQADAMRKATTDTTLALEFITNTIQNIAHSSLAIQKSVGEQTITVNEVANSGSTASSAAQRILRNVQESAAGLREISNSAAGLERDAASTLQGIEVVRNNASQLAETTDELKRVVGRFKL